MRKEIFTKDNWYHVCSRGVDKRCIYMNDLDNLRFLHNMFEFNDTEGSLPYMARMKGDNIGTQIFNIKKRKKIVEIACFCLMPNHFHFIIKPLIEGGLSSFMGRLCGGYSRHFNLEHERSGTLFQGPFKAKLIESDAQMMHLARYIHILNPGELVEPQIREGIIKDPAQLKLFLKNYKWSSHLDYLGVKNYPSLTDRQFISEYFNDIMDYEKFMMSWRVDNLDLIEDVLIK